MRVYVAISRVKYEGDSMMGVFETAKEAWACADTGYALAVVEEFDTQDPEHWEEVGRDGKRVDR